MISSAILAFVSFAVGVICDFFNAYYGTQPIKTERHNSLETMCSICAFAFYIISIVFCIASFVKI